MATYKYILAVCLLSAGSLCVFSQFVNTGVQVQDLSLLSDGNCTNCSGNCTENSICEQDCKDNFYGKGCNLSCAESCKGSCNRTNGVCDFCEDGRYDAFCTETCSHNCSNGCSQTKGHCNSCPYNHFGDYCENICGEHCLSGCNSKSGDCPFCYNGYWGTNCSNRCAPNCIGECYKYRGDCFHCISGYTGVHCQRKCSDTNCQSCYFVNNNTDVCRTCVDGWYGEHCTERCNDNCKDNRCTLSDGSCDCTPGWFGLDCGQACMKNCVSCGDYSSCYTCKDGYFGVNCDQKCPDYCSACSRDGMECKYAACKRYPNEYGSHCECRLDKCKRQNRFKFCEECENGWFLSKRGCCPCQEHCNRTCNNETGICINGCQDGYHGDKCNIKCSEHCLGGVKTCNYTTGLCLNGCERDWYKPTCDFQCKFNYPYCKKCGLIYIGNGYGVTCNECDDGYRFWNGNCMPCDTCNDGKCSEMFGCETGCMPGSFGMYCINKCPKNCYACDKIFGTCLICHSHYTGPKCESTCLNCINPFENTTSELFRGACPAGAYGIHCNKTCGQCRPLRTGEVAQCDRVTGSCLAGCVPEYYGFLCSSSCQKCKRTVLSSVRVCDSKSGICRHGCSDGYFGSLCNNSCSSHCGGNGTCEQSTGNCLHGCVAEWHGMDCNDKNTSAPSTTVEKLTAPQIAGVVVGCVLGVAAVVTAAILLYRRKLKLKRDSYNIATQYQLRGQS